MVMLGGVFDWLWGPVGDRGAEKEVEVIKNLITEIGLYLTARDLDQVVCRLFKLEESIVGPAAVAEANKCFSELLAARPDSQIEFDLTILLSQPIPKVASSYLSVANLVNKINKMADIVSVVRDSEYSQFEIFSRIREVNFNRRNEAGEGILEVFVKAGKSEHIKLILDRNLVALGDLDESAKAALRASPKSGDKMPGCEGLECKRVAFEEFSAGMTKIIAKSVGLLVVTTTTMDAGNFVGDEEKPKCETPKVSLASGVKRLNSQRELTHREGGK